MKSLLLVILPIAFAISFVHRGDTAGVVWSLSGLALGVAIFVFTELKR